MTAIFHRMGKITTTAFLFVGVVELAVLQPSRSVCGPCAQRIELVGFQVGYARSPSQMIQSGQRYRVLD